MENERPDWECLEMWDVYKATRSLEHPKVLRPGWYSSRKLVAGDGSTETVLEAMARIKFGQWPANKRPCWKDKDWRNESFDNISFQTRYSVNRAPRQSSSSFAAGTPEYYQEWRKKHPENAKRARRKYYAKLQAVMKRAGRTPTGLTPEETVVSEAAVAQSDRFLSMVDKIGVKLDEHGRIIQGVENEGPKAPADANNTNLDNGEAPSSGIRTGNESE